MNLPTHTKAFDQLQQSSRAVGTVRVRVSPLKRRDAKAFLKDADIFIRGIFNIQACNPIPVVAYPQMQLLTLKKHSI